MSAPFAPPASPAPRGSRLPQRLLRLYLGLVLYGASGALQLRAGLGLGPWDVFHQGVARHSGLSIGTVSIVAGAVVLLLWIPLRERPGLGTASNVVVVGLALDATLALAPEIRGTVPRVALLGFAVALNGLATGLYISARFGAGPRDGLMTRLHELTGRSVRLVRTSIEVTVLACGYLLGGTAGVGTVVYALAIGPLSQLFLRLFGFSPRKSGPVPEAEAEAGALGQAGRTSPSHTAAVTTRRHPFLDHPTTLAFAHRGGAADGLENTAAAFHRATEAGYRYLETDVHCTADGALVAFHDATLDRVTDARGRLAELPWSEVRQARVAGTERLPLFEELLEEFPTARWNIDIKTGRAVEPLVDLVGRRNAWDRVCLGSFSEARIARAQRLAGPRLATSLGTRGVVGLRLRSHRLPAWPRRTALAAQVPERHSGVRVVDRPFVRAAHRRGLQVHVWTVNDPNRMEALLDLGVDGIMTDHIETLRTVLKGRGDWA